MKKILIVLFALVLMFSLVACSSDDSDDFSSGGNSSTDNSGDGNNNTTPTPTPEPEKEPSIAGKYLLSEVESFGDVLNYADLKILEMTENSYLEIKEDNTTIMSLSGEAPAQLTINTDTKVILDPDGFEATYELVGDNFIISYDEGGDLTQFTFTKENSPSWATIEAQTSELEGLLDEFDSSSSAVEIEVGSEWYGSMTISEYSGPNNANGTYDIWGFIGEDSYKPYFEIYDSYDITANVPLVSYYIELDTDIFFPVIEDDDSAWIFQKYLTEDDYFDFVPLIWDGAIEFWHEYSYEGESFYVEFFLREVGSTDWDEDFDPLPPGYYDYAN